MLVLSRQKDESVIIADGEIVITVVDIRGDKVRLGFAASTDIPIHRKEIWDKIQKEKAVEEEKQRLQADRVANQGG